VNTQTWQQPTTYQRADNADSNISDKAKPCSLHDLASKPTRNETDYQNYE
jgi:hypothetical protein